MKKATGIIIACVASASVAVLLLLILLRSRANRRRRAPLPPVRALAHHRSRLTLNHERCSVSSVPFPNHLVLPSDSDATLSPDGSFRLATPPQPAFHAKADRSRSSFGSADVSSSAPSPALPPSPSPPPERKLYTPPRTPPTHVRPDSTVSVRSTRTGPRTPTQIVLPTPLAPQVQSYLSTELGGLRPPSTHLRRHSTLYTADRGSVADPWAAPLVRTVEARAASIDSVSRLMVQPLPTDN